MVKALVFGTKDLCVRIAPWSLLQIHSFFSHFCHKIVISMTEQIFLSSFWMKRGTTNKVGLNSHDCLPYCQGPENS